MPWNCRNFSVKKFKASIEKLKSYYIMLETGREKHIGSLDWNRNSSYISNCTIWATNQPTSIHPASMAPSILPPCNLPPSNLHPSKLPPSILPPCNLPPCNLPCPIQILGPCYMLEIDKSSFFCCMFSINVFFMLFYLILSFIFPFFFFFIA